MEAKVAMVMMMMMTLMIPTNPDPIGAVVEVEVVVLAVAVVAEAVVAEAMVATTIWTVRKATRTVVAAVLPSL